MEDVIRGIPNTVVFLDDICVSGVSKDDHIKNLREVFRRLQAVGLRIKLAKCDFFKPRVCYLGHVIDKDGLHPDERKIKALLDAPHPRDLQQLRAFLGLVNYYGRFVNNLTTILKPMHNLLKKNIVWNWNSECNEAFEKIKKILTGKNVLAHYNPNLPLVLSVDSSAYGVGGVLAHRYSDGSERPICCVSRTLSDAEKSYSQLDKEALAIFYGVTKNHQYLFGRKFIIRTDHKPLSYIFGDKVGIPQTAASRLQRYAARLAAYDFTVEWVASAANAPADCLSRLPLGAPPAINDAREDCSYLHYVEQEFPISYRHIAEATRVDPILRKIYDYILNGWPPSSLVEQELAYFHRKDNLFIERGCIVYNYRIVVPSKYREYILHELHEGHLGVVKMKSIARNYVYWPGLDAALEQLCRACAACRQQRAAPPHAPLTSWEFPQRPWLRLHADFAEYNAKHYLIVVDAHSKWIEAFQLNSTAAKFVIAKFRELFARFGLPVQIVTDNGPPFSSRELDTYFKRNGIIHNRTSPYRPKGNGAAENAVKTVKNCIKKACYEGTDVEQAISKMLFQYRNCPHATTGVEPAMALLGRRLRGRLDALMRGPDVAPDVAARVLDQQHRQEQRAGGVPRTASPGDHVLVRDYSKSKDKWVEGIIQKKVGPASFDVTLSGGTARRHIDQILTPKGSCAKRYSVCAVSGNNVTRSDIYDKSPVSGEAENSAATAVKDSNDIPSRDIDKDISSEPAVDEEVSEMASSTSPPPTRSRMFLRPRKK
jgi:transposase InsO family protein